VGFLLWISHFFNRKQCVDNLFWWYDKLICSKCKRTIAYFTNYKHDGHKVVGKELYVEKPYLKYIDEKQKQNIKETKFGVILGDGESYSIKFDDVKGDINDKHPKSNN